MSNQDIALDVVICHLFSVMDVVLGIFVSLFVVIRVF